MGDSYSTVLPNEIKSRVRGFPANYFGDLVPLGFIKPFENLSSSPSDIPKGNYTFDPSDNFVYFTDSNGEEKTVPSYKFTITAVAEDLESAVEDESTGKKEKIYYLYIEYSYLSNERIEGVDQEFIIGAFEIPKTRSVANYRIHIFNEERFIPGPDTEFDIYLSVGDIGALIFNPYYRGDTSPETISKILTAFPEEPRFSSSVVKLLPSRSLSLWLGFGGGVDLIGIGDVGSQLDNLAQSVIGAGLASGFALSTQANLRLLAPVQYRPFNIKYGYSVVKSSQTIFDEELTLTKDYVDNNSILGNNCIIANISLGGDGEYVGDCFCVSRKKFNFNEVEKRYIGKGLQTSGDPRDGINQSRFLDSEPLPFAIVKDKLITSTFTRQVSSLYDSSGLSLTSAGSVYTSIPEKQIPGGRCNLQIFLPLNFFDSSEDKKIYITYLKVREPQLRQVNSYRFEVYAASAGNIDASARTFLHSSCFNHDSFYVKNKMLYDIKKGPLSSVSFNAVFEGVNNLQGYPAVLDISQTPIDFRPTLSQIVNAENEGLLKFASCYRMSGRRILPKSVDFFLSEGLFVAAAFFRTPDGALIEGGIAYVDGFGSVRILMPASQVRDQKWWNDNFGSLGTVISGRDYIERLNATDIRYDRSIYSNSLLTDYEKVGYDILLAEALQTITPLSKGGLGVGICLLDFFDTKTGALQFKNFISDAVRFYPGDADIAEGANYIDLSEANFEKAIVPNWYINVIQITNPALNSIGINVRRGSIVAESACFDVSPVDLSRNGRIFWEEVVGVGAIEGVQKFEQIWIRSNVYDVKVGFASDFYKNIGIYGKFDAIKNNIRIFPVQISPILSYNNMYDFNLKRDKVDSETEDYLFNSIKWYGMPVDSLPFYQKGIESMASENDRFTSTADPDSDAKFFKIKGSYENSSSSGSIDRGLMKGLSRDFYGEAYIPVDESLRIRQVYIKCFVGKDTVSSLKKYLRQDPNIMCFAANVKVGSQSISRNKSEEDAVVFASFSFLGDQALKAVFNVPSYRGNIVLSGPAIHFVNNFSSNNEVDIVCYRNSEFENFVFSANDVYPAIDGFTNGYVGCVSSKDPTPSVDIYVTGDQDMRWKLFRNVFQSFVNDNIYQLVLKADQKGMKLYIMFSLNGVLLCKPIDGRTIFDLRVTSQPVVSKNAFIIGQNSSSYVFALNDESYDALQNTNNTENYDLDHQARMKPAYIVQALYDNNEFIKQEYINTLACGQLLEVLNKARGSGGDSGGVPASLKINTDFGNFNLSIPEYLKNNTGSRIYPRINVSSIPESDTLQERYWPVNQPYTFEVLSDGSLIAFVLKEGFINIFRSSTGENWDPAFVANKTVGYRPIKWSIVDQDSYFNTQTSESVAGSCPPVENISSCYDFSSNTLTLFYVISNCVFAQHFYDKQLLAFEDGIAYYLNTRDVSQDSRMSSRNRPFYVVGQMPAELISAGKEGNNYVYSGNRIEGNVSGITNTERILFEQGFGESTSSVRTNGKAPGAAYVGPGIIRLYYEDEGDSLRGATISEKYVKLDLNRNSDY